MTENSLGKLLVDTAAESGVQHFIYSGLVSAKLLTNGAVASECFDGKAAPVHHLQLQHPLISE